MNRFRRAFAALSIALLAMTAVPAMAAADSKGFLGQIGKSAGYADSEDVSGDGLPEVIGGIIKALLGILGVVFVVLMVYAGFLWMTARGDSKAVDKAKDVIRQAVIGFIITALAYAITGFVVSALAGASKKGDSGLVCVDGGSCSDNSDCDDGAICLDPAGGPPGALGTCTCLQ